MNDESNPFLRRIAKRGDGRAGVRSEIKTAKRLGARQQVASGALPSLRGDMTLGDFLIEAKSTAKDSIGVPLSFLTKISGEASRANKTPALSIAFTTKDGTPRRDGTWVAVPEHVFKEMLAKCR